MLGPLLDADPDHPELLRLAGIATLQLGRAQRACEHLARAAAAAPASAAVRCNLGSALRAANRHAEARAAFEAALAREPDLAEAHNNLGALAQAGGALDEARSHFARARELAGPASTATLNLAGLELTAGRAARARALLAPLDAAKGLPGSIAAAARRLDALALAELGPYPAARAALEAFPGDPELQHRLGSLCEQHGDWQAALAAQERALALAPDHGPALSDCLFLRRRLCRWERAEADRARLRAALERGVAGLKPFALLSEDVSPAAQQGCARRWAARFSGLPRLPARAPATGRPTVGFLSNGFRNHPTGCLVAELFEVLDRERFGWNAYATDPDDGSALRQRLRRSVASFRELHGHDHGAMARRIAADGVDVLVDLRGYGGGAVTEVLARRPAPVQVNWLAYPGTLGAPFVDYIVLDRVVAPATVVACLDEAPVYLPHSYQPCDTTRDWTRERLSRAAAGLPPTGPVLASFNNSYKFSPEVFAVWMAILAAVPDAVLWLLDGPAGAGVADRLRAAAGRAGIDPARLHFLAKQPHLAYLARYEHVDLFLDTLPYNAHTTAGDALFAGCPVLTCAGGTFAGRVAASLLGAVELGGLVTESLTAYRAKAIELLRAPGALARLRGRLEARRAALPLFDTPRLARELEVAFGVMVDRARAGRPPAPITVPPGGRDAAAG